MKNNNYPLYFLISASIGCIFCILPLFFTSHTPLEGFIVLGAIIMSILSLIFGLLAKQQIAWLWIFTATIWIFYYMRYFI